MITALCANPCIDRMVDVERFQYGGMNRILSQRQEPSGKGVNVAIAAAQLGAPSACVALLAREGAAGVRERLQAHGCTVEAVDCPGAVRVNLKLRDRATAVVTEVNEPGVQADAQHVQALQRACMDYAQRSDFLVLTGSLPQGIPPSFYRDVLQQARVHAPQCRVVVDAEGEPLRLAVQARPALIKPNRYELQLLCGAPMDTLAHIDAAARSLCAQGVGVAVVSLGGEGAYCTDGRRAFFAPPMAVPVVSTVGAGDCLVAGMLCALAAGQPLPRAFAAGVAAASASVTTPGTMLIDTQIVADLLAQVRVQEV